MWENAAGLRAPRQVIEDTGATTCWFKDLVTQRPRKVLTASSHSGFLECHCCTHWSCIASHRAHCPKHPFRYVLEFLHSCGCPNGWGVIVLFMALRRLTPGLGVFYPLRWCLSETYRSCDGIVTVTALRWPVPILGPSYPLWWNLLEVHRPFDSIILVTVLCLDNIVLVTVSRRLKLVPGSSLTVAVVIVPVNEFPMLCEFPFRTSSRLFTIVVELF